MASVLFFKAIKPKKMKDKEIMRHVRNAVLRVGRGIQRDYEKTVKTWDEKPSFIMTRDLSHQPISFFVGTDNLTYKFVDEGTGTGREEGGGDSYPIFPVTAKALAYQQDFTPKTTPMSLTSTSGGKSGAMLIRNYVEHPGIEARKFTTTIREKWRPRFKKAMEEAIKSGVLATGHGR